MNNENKSSAQEIKMPKELKELSNAAVMKQILINEACEDIHHAHMQFLRAFNGAVNDPEAIRIRAKRVLEAYQASKVLVESIVTPYLD